MFLLFPNGLFVIHKARYQRQSAWHLIQQEAQRDGFIFSFEVIESKQIYNFLCIYFPDCLH